MACPPRGQGGRADPGPLREWWSVQNTLWNPTFHWQKKIIATGVQVVIQGYYLLRWFLSPAQEDGWGVCPDILLHTQWCGTRTNKRKGMEPEKDGRERLETAKSNYRGIVEKRTTDSSWKSATNSVLWFEHEWRLRLRYPTSNWGEIAHIFFNTMEDSGALPIEMDALNLNMGDDVIDIYSRKGLDYLKTNMSFAERRSVPVNVSLSHYILDGASPRRCVSPSARMVVAWMISLPCPSIPRIIIPWDFPLLKKNGG